MVIFQNLDWVVDAAGIHSVGGPSAYEIPTERLLERTNRGSTKYYHWPVHVAEKSWVDPVAFNDAFDAAVNHLATDNGTPIDKNMLHASYVEAERIG